MDYSINIYENDYTFYKYPKNNFTYFCKFIKKRNKQSILLTNNEIFLINNINYFKIMTTIITTVITIRLGYLLFKKNEITTSAKILYSYLCVYHINKYIYTNFDNYFETTYLRLLYKQKYNLFNNYKIKGCL